jgi:hypothetical protein
MAQNMERRTTTELIRIVSAGGGLKLEAGRRTTEELVRIASAAKSGGGLLYLSGLSNRTTDELVQIVSASKGRVVIES